MLFFCPGGSRVELLHLSELNVGGLPIPERANAPLGPLPFWIPLVREHFNKPVISGVEDGFYLSPSTDVGNVRSSQGNV